MRISTSTSSSLVKRERVQCMVINQLASAHTYAGHHLHCKIHIDTCFLSERSIVQKANCWMKIATRFGLYASKVTTSPLICPHFERVHLGVLENGHFNSFGAVASSALFSSSSSFCTSPSPPLSLSSLLRPRRMYFPDNETRATESRNEAH